MPSGEAPAEQIVISVVDIRIVPFKRRISRVKAPRVKNSKQEGGGAKYRTIRRRARENPIVRSRSAFHLASRARLASISLRFSRGFPAPDTPALLLEGEHEGVRHFLLYRLPPIACPLRSSA